MKSVAILLYAMIGWGLCGAMIGLGRALTTLETALIIHMIGAPAVFVLLAILYFKRCRYTSPLQTASIFLGIVIFMDIFVVAMVIENSLKMFRSPTGTWVPFILIFSATYITGKAAVAKR